jgi:hypothetical protein
MQNFASDHCQGHKYTNAGAFSEDLAWRHALTAGSQRSQVAWMYKLSITTVIAVDGYEHVALSREHLDYNDVEPTLHEVETLEHPKWKDTSEHSPI